MLDIIVLIGSILLGILISWRESRTNSIFRAYNAFINKKETRMEASDRKGFFYQRSIIYRLLNVLFLTILFGMLVYNTPLLNNHVLEVSLAFFVGVLGGTYLAAALPTVKRAVDNPLDALKEVGDAGKEVLSDLSETATEKLKERKGETVVPPVQKKTEEPEEPKKETARERMKRKGYLK
jgi:hypothetical protein